MQKQAKPRKKKRTFAVTLVVFILIVAVMIVCAAVSYKFVTNTNKSDTREASINVDPENGIPIDIPMGSNTASIANILKDKGIIRYPNVFKILSKLNGYDGMYQSGTHFVENDKNRDSLTNIVKSYDRLMRILIDKPHSIKVVIPEGYTYKQITDALYRKKLIDTDKFDNVANKDKFDYKFLQDLTRKNNRLEGYLFPDTYEFDLKAGEKEIIRRMLENFNNKFKPQYYDDIKKLNEKYKKYNLKMDVDRIIILASMIEREAKDDAERAVIAGVFYNRLTGMNKAPKTLESCATIQYIYLNKDSGISEENKKRIQKGIILDSDTAIDDPYNTYKRTGLPPGPICCPGKASIEAALRPADTKFLYFVAMNDGSGKHDFSLNLKEHQIKQKKYAANVN